MKDRDKNKKALAILCALCAVFFLLRFWHFLFAGIFMAVVYGITVFAAKPKREEQKENTQNGTTENKDSVYNEVANKITEKVRSEFPNAKWVFRHPKAISVLQAGDKVNIILNGAGGYRKAEVRLSGGEIETTYITEDEKREEPTKSEEEREDVTEDYGLMAFEWVESHIDWLNSKLNEIISEKESEYVVPSNELPDPESWESVCEELKRQGLTRVKIIPEGIKIIIK